MLRHLRLALRGGQIPEIKESTSQISNILEYSVENVRH